MVDVWLPYGNTEVCLTVPTKNFLGKVEPNDKRGMETPQLEIERALMEPFGTKRLSEISTGEKVSIVVNSVKDSVLALLILKSIFKELSKAGVKSKNVKIIKGYDPLQGYATLDELHLQSVEALREAELVTHDPEAGIYTDIGKTSFGTRVQVSRTFLESDVKILAGVLEPHPYAGYSGGGDGILPGVSNAETIQQNLSMVTDPKACFGMVKDNPVREDMTEAAHLAEADFVLNVVKSPKGEAVKAFFGHPDEAFREGVKFADEVYKAEVKSRADAVFISPGGFPLDSDLCGSCNGISKSSEIVKRNGVIVLVAECREGYGNDEFYKWIVESKDLNWMERQLRRRFTAGRYVAYSFMKALQKGKVVLVSALPDYYALRIPKLKTVRSVNEALRYILDVTKRNAKVLAILYGNLSILKVKP